MRPYAPPARSPAPLPTFPLASPASVAALYSSLCGLPSATLTPGLSAALGAPELAQGWPQGPALVLLSVLLTGLCAGLAHLWLRPRQPMQRLAVGLPVAVGCSLLGLIIKGGPAPGPSLAALILLPASAALAWLAVEGSLGAWTAPPAARSAPAPDLMPDHPARRYYRSMRGRWRGLYRLKESAPGALAAARLPLQQQLQARALLLCSALPPALVIETRLDDQPDHPEGEILHWTCLRWLGLPVYRSVERFRFGPDGRRGQVEGAMAPLLAWSAEEQRGAVQIDEDARGASYDLPMLGGRMQQRTRAVEEGLEIEQRCGWGQAELLLLRRSLAP